MILQTSPNWDCIENIRVDMNEVASSSILYEMQVMSSRGLKSGKSCVCYARIHMYLRHQAHTRTYRTATATIGLVYSVS